MDGKRVTSVKNCVKNFKNSASMKVIWRIRRKFCSVNLPKVEEVVAEEETFVNPEVDLLLSHEQKSKEVLQQSTNEKVVHQYHQDEEIKNGDSSKVNHVDNNSTASSEFLCKTNNPTTTPSPSRRNSFAQEIDNAATAAFNAAAQDSSSSNLENHGSRDRKMSYGFKPSLNEGRHCQVLRTGETPFCRVIDYKLLQLFLCI